MIIVNTKHLLKIKDRCLLVIDCELNFEDIESQLIEPIIAFTIWPCHDMLPECDVKEQFHNRLLIINKILFVLINSKTSY